MSLVLLAGAGLSWCTHAADDPSDHNNEALTSDQASGTETWSGAITGTSSITKTGGSTLVLSNTGNTFTGAIALQKGNIQANAPHAFGSGTITMTHGAYIYVNTAGEISNRIVASGNAWLRFKDMTVKGSPRSEPTVFKDEVYTPNTIEITSDNLAATPIRWTFEKPVTATSNAIGVYFWGQARFEDAVTCDGRFNLGAGISYNSQQPAVVLCSPKNKVAQYCVAHGSIICGETNVLRGATVGLSWRGWDGQCRDCIDLGGYDQILDAVTCLADAGYTYTGTIGCRVFTDDAKPATLTVTKGSETAYPVRVMGPVSLVLDAPDGAWVFRTRQNTTTGGIYVTNGTFKVTGNASFKSVPEVVVAPNGKLVVDASAASGALAGVKRLTVEGEFDVSAATDAIRTDGDLTLCVPASGSDLVKLPSGTVLKAKAVVVGGVSRQGFFTHDNLPQLAEGVTVVAVSEASSFATWTGAGADAAMTTDGNWLSGVAPDVEGGGLHMDFAATATDNRTEMQYGATTFIDSITNTLPQTTGSSVVRKPMWIKPASDDAWLILNGSIWNAGAAQLVLAGHITALGVPAGTKANVAAKKIYCDLPYVEQKNFPQGVIECALAQTANRTEPLVLAGASVEAPIHVKAYTSGLGIVGYAHTTNDIYGNVYVENNHCVVGSQEGGSLVFRGGLDSTLSLYAMGPGTVKISDNPANFGYGGSMMGGVHLVFDAANCRFNGNTAREGLLLGVGQSETSLEFLRDNCLASDQQLHIDVGAGKMKQSIELHSTTQQVGRLNLVNTHAETSVHGDYPSMFRIFGSVRSGSTASLRKELKCSVPVTGGVGFSFESVAADGVFTLEGQDFASCGDLAVSSGTLVLAAGASWRNGTHIRVSGTGTLRLAEKRQLGRSCAQLHFSDSGKVEIPAGVSISVSAADVGGVAVAPGQDTKASTGVMADRVSGDGVLLVGGCGMLIIFR